MHKQNLAFLEFKTLIEITTGLSYLYAKCGYHGKLSADPFFFNVVGRLVLLRGLLQYLGSHSKELIIGLRFIFTDSHDPMQNHANNFWQKPAGEISSR